MTCIHKFVGCRIDVDEQPAALPTKEFTDFEEYYCPECLLGYFWDMENEPWSCRPCNQSDKLTNSHHCLQCPSAQRCTDCDQNFFPTFLQNGCMLPIANCKTNPAQYTNDGSVFVCPECMQGYYQEGSSCKECLSDEEGDILFDGSCVACKDSTTCAQCAEGYMMHPDATTWLIYDEDGENIEFEFPACFEEFENCQLLPNMYTETEGRLWCSECISGYTWNFLEEECQVCGDVFENCADKCSFIGCEECADGYFLGEDGECYEEFDHCEEHDWNDDYGVYCSECDDGLFFIAYALDPDQDEPEPGCIDCNDEAWGIQYCESCSNYVEEDEDENDWILWACDKCEGGYTPSPSQSRCIPKIEFAVIPLDEQELEDEEELKLQGPTTPV